VKTVEIRGVWLIKDHEHLGNMIHVVVELTDGTHHEIMADRAEGPISHYVHPSGIVNAPLYDLGDKK
jgi:hypothetical protein